MNISGELVIGLSAIFYTGLGAVLAYAFRIKCSELSMCYCFTCKRDVDGENELYQLELEHQDHIPHSTDT
jgi:hypothetical protein